MLSLADDIVRSYEDRISGIAELREIVKVDLKDFQDSRVAMAKELRADLAKDEEERLREARALKQELVKGVAERKSAVKTQLKELDDAHATMSKELKADLAEGEEERLKEARALKQDLVRGVAERKSAMGAQLKELDAAHAAMSREMRAELAEGRQSLAKEAREFMGELGRAVAEGKAATQALLRDFGEEQAGARDEWQKLTATMQSKRGGVAVAVKPPIEEIAEGAAEITTETAALRGQVFEYLANHPDGTKLVEIAEEFSVARIQMAKVVKKLMDENKVEKRELLYFAV